MLSPKNEHYENLNQHIIIDGGFAIVQKIGGEHLRLCRLFAGQKVLIEKLSFDPKNAIGKQFGMFEVSINGFVTPLPPVLQTTVVIDDKMVAEKNEHIPLKNSSTNSKSVEEISSQIQQNANIVRQKMTMEEILDLRNGGIATIDIVSKLVEGNASFQHRTVFSKEKYVRKKAKKHSDRIMIFRPNIRLLSQTYFRKDSERLAHLKLDQLGLLLQYCAIHTGNCNILVYEQTLGLLGAAILERLAGYGNCIFLHRGDWPQSIPCIDAMEFDEQHLQTFLPLRITTLLKPESLYLEEEMPAEVIAESERNKTNLNDDEVIATKKPRIEINTTQERKSNSLQLKKLQRTDKERRALELISYNGADVNEGKLDAICLATRTFDPVNVLKKVYSGLRLSGKVVIYSPFKSHLLATWKWLHSTNSFIDIQLSKQFCRFHQVLPNRTHPLMQQAVTGGYVLYATKVVVPLQHQNMTKSLLSVAS